MDKVRVVWPIPVITLHHSVMVLPGTTSQILLRSNKYKELLTQARDGKVPIVFSVIPHPDVQNYPDSFHGRVGVISRLEVVHSERPEIFLKGLYRAIMLNLKRNREDQDSYWLTDIEEIEDKEDQYVQKVGGTFSIRPEHHEAFNTTLNIAKRLLMMFIEESTGLDDVDLELAENIVDNFENLDLANYSVADEFIWKVVSVLPEIPVKAKQYILESRLLTERISWTIMFLKKNISEATWMKEIDQAMEGSPGDKAHIDRSGDSTNNAQAQEKRIIKQNDVMAGAHPEVARRYKKFLELKEFMNELAQKAIMQRLKKLKSLTKVKEISQEYSTIEEYVDIALELPWNSRTPTEGDIKKVAEILDKDHYGMESVKKKILRNLAAKLMNPKGKGPILCLVGPPGVGKTSVAQSIAKALGRKLIRLSLGGIHDEAEIRGHRSTYINALMGEIMEGLRKAGVKNLVFVLDEVDKIGEDFRGNPASALIEVLDPEQNHSFKDHYLAFPFDLSEVLFICTANVTDSIKPALLNRMNVIELPGYTEEEKLQIAKRYLLKKAHAHAGFDEHGIEVLWPDNDPDELLSKIISGYTRESGVRGLERNIIELHEELDKQYLEVEVELRPKSLSVTEEFVYKTLGEPTHTHERASVTEAGEAIGLAVTESGCGDIIYVHASLVSRGRGDKDISQTGGLLEVFQEANKNATSAVKRLPSIDRKMLCKFRDNLLHLSVPDGAIKKDGPSAGITMAIAIYSELTGKLVKPYLGMTGEITIKGRIRAIGGVREKVLAAVRDGLKEVILPRSNQKAIKNIPEEVRRKLQFHFVENIGEALKIAFPEDRPAS